MHDDAVEIHNRPDWLQRPRPPGGHLGVEIGRDFGNQRGGDLHIVQFAHDLLNVARGHPLGIQREDLFIEARQAPLVFADQLRLERAVAIARRGDAQFAQVALHRFAGPPIATVGRAFGWARRRRRWLGCGRRLGQGLVAVGSEGQRLAAQVYIHLRIQHPLQGGLHHQPHQAVEVLGRLGLDGHFTC